MTSNLPNYSDMHITEVENGWIVNCGSSMGRDFIGTRFVFASLSGLAQWLMGIEAARAPKSSNMTAMKAPA